MGYHLSNMEEIYFEKEAREKIFSGINKLCKAVSKTMGPSGKTIIIPSKKEYGKYIITKDGVSVAEQVFFKDPIENIGAEKIEFIIDRDEKRIDGEFHGVPFKEFSEIKPSAELLLLITTMFYDEEKILSNARKLGVGKNNILRIEDEILNLINMFHNSIPMKVE